jgi:hypothetical protein
MLYARQSIDTPRRQHVCITGSKHALCIIAPEDCKLTGALPLDLNLIFGNLNGFFLLERI